MNTENDMKIIRSKLINLQNDLDDIVSITSGALTFSEEEHTPALVTRHNKQQQAVINTLPEVVSLPQAVSLPEAVSHEGGKKNKTKSNKRKTKRNSKTSKRNRNRK